MRRANRTAVERTENGYIARFYKTHTQVGIYEVSDAEWQASKDANATKAREEFRALAIAHALDIGVEWQPELQQQAWDRHFWKYENDSQVEEDAVTLMYWTIERLATKSKINVSISDISLDSIIAGNSNLSYVVDGRYEKNGNWAVATVNLAVNLQYGEEIQEIIYPIEMRSGQLTKIKMDIEEFRTMLSDVFDIKIEQIA